MTRISVSQALFFTFKRNSFYRILCRITTRLSTVVTPGRLNFAIFVKFSKNSAKYTTKQEIPSDCYTCFTFLCNSPRVSTVPKFSHGIEWIIRIFLNLQQKKSVRKFTLKYGSSFKRKFTLAKLLYYKDV